MSSSNGTHEESISNLPLFFHNLERTNPNTVTKIKKDMYDRMQMCFVALGCGIYTFCTCMLPVLYVDIVPFKGDYFSSMFIAVAVDGNHEELVIAFGVGGMDSIDSSRWFLSELKKCLGNVAQIGFITKMFGSVSTAVEGVFPDSYHGFCYRDVVRNFLDMYGHNNTLRMLFKETCHTYSMTDFQDHLTGLKNMLRLQNIWIESFSCDKWGRAWFPPVRWNIMKMDIPSVLQMLAGERRARPITQFIQVILDDIRCTYLQRSHMSMTFSYITPYAKNVLDRRIQKSKHWDANHRGDLYFRVTDFRQTEEVWLNGNNCYCRKWKTSGIPCRHAIAALRSLNMINYEEVVDILCTSAIYRAAYAWGVAPVPPPNEWELPNEVNVLLPPI